MQFRCALRLERLQLVGIDEVLVRPAAAEEQVCGSYGLALFLERSALLQETAERREARPRADHDDGRGRFGGEAERRLGVLDEGIDDVLRALRTQIVRANTLECARPRAMRLTDHRNRDRARIRRHQGRRRDRVVARAERRQHFEIDVERQFAGAVLIEQVDDGLALVKHVGAVARLAGLVVAGERFQLRPGMGATRVGRHGRDVLAARDVLQLDILAKQARDAQRLIDGQHAFAPVGSAQHDARFRREIEALGYAPHEGRRVVCDDAEVIAGAIGRAGRQLHLDMPRRAGRRFSACLRMQFAIDQDRRRHCTERGDERAHLLLGNDVHGILVRAFA